MGRFLFAGMLFFSLTMSADGLKTTMEEVGLDKFCKIVCTRGSLTLPQVTIKMSTTIVGDEIIYDGPQLYLDDKIVECEICKQPPVTISYSNGKITAYCLAHVPRQTHYKPSSYFPNVAGIQPIPEPPADIPL